MEEEEDDEEKKKAMPEGRSKEDHYLVLLKHYNHVEMIEDDTDETKLVKILGFWDEVKREETKECEAYEEKKEDVKPDVEEEEGDEEKKKSVPEGMSMEDHF